MPAADRALLLVLKRGQKFTICILRSHEADFRKLVDKQLADADYKKIRALLEECADFGLPRNPHKCRKLTPQYPRVFELKSWPYRLLFFLDGRNLVMTNWFAKQRDSGEPVEYRKADLARQDYLAMKGGSQ